MRPKPSTWLLINHPDQAPGGAGEAVCRPVAGAIANVLFDALACGCAAARVKSALG
jgi:CO/xanthine dehydrogenase Mo-binding subunit